MDRIIFENSKSLSDFIKGFVDKYTEETIKHGVIDSYINALNTKLELFTKENDPQLELIKFNIDSMVSHLESIKDLIDKGKNSTMEQFDKINFEAIMKR